jgi:hypothetical protein
MLQRDGVVMVKMKVLVMRMMVMIFSFQEGISPADFCLPESFSLSGVFRPAEVAVSISEPPFDLGFWGR